MKESSTSGKSHCADKNQKMTIFSSHCDLSTSQTQMAILNTSVS